MLTAPIVRPPLGSAIMLDRVGTNVRTTLRAKRKFAVSAGLVFCGSLFATPHVFSLDPDKALTQYVRQVWSKEEGMPASVVEDIVQTPDGYLWLATSKGLVRFDGVQFRVFNSTNTKEIESDAITRLALDQAGVLWVGAENGLVYRLKDANLTSFGTRDGLPGLPVTALLPETGGGLWIGTLGGGLSLVKGGKTTTVKGLSKKIVLSLCNGADGSVWIGTANGGLSRLSKGELTSYGPREGLSSTYVSSVCEDHQGNLWVGTKEGINLLSKDVVTRPDRDTGRGSIAVRKVFEDRQGNVWIGTFEDGLCRVKDGKFVFYATKEGLSDNLVLALQEDREGNLWIGTRGGLERWSGGSFTCYTTVEGLPADTVTTVCDDHEGAVWLGTQAGLSRLKNGVVSTYTTREGLSSNKVTSVCAGEDGSIWIGTAGGGLNELRGGQFVGYTTRSGLPSNTIWSLCRDRLGRVWIGTSSGLAVLQNGKLKTFSTKDGLPGGMVLDTYEDRDGQIWVAAHGGGLSRYKDGAFVTYTEKDGLTSNFVSTIYQDADGCLWIATWGGGLNRFKNGRFASCTTKNGLADDLAFGILEDGLGNLWVRGAQCVFSIDKKALEDLADGRSQTISCAIYGRADGIKRDEHESYSQPAAWRGRDGRLWFPSLQGVAVVDPREVRKNPLPPPVHIEQVVIDGRATIPDARSAASFVIPAGAERIEFQYTGLSFVASRRMQFKFKLDGYDADWVSAGTMRVASYTHVPPGSYTFRAIACNSSGVWNTTGAELNVQMLPQFYQTYWFYALCGLGAILSLRGLHRYRIRHLQAQQRALSAQVVEALSHIKVLRGLLPICSACKKIRDDAGYWNQMEVYVRDHSEAEFTHGICPDCLRRLYPSLMRASEEPRGSE